MVLEYLSHSGFDRAVVELKAQLRERRTGKQPARKPFGLDAQLHIKERLLKAFDSGQHDEVLKLWENFVPPLVRRTQPEAQKIEFNLRVYMAIYPIHPSRRPSVTPAAFAASMAAFKTFLETDGAALATTPEFLAYYAMPHVPDIAAHPSFTELFSVEWPLALRVKLGNYLSLSHQVPTRCRPLSPRQGRMTVAIPPPHPGALTQPAARRHSLHRSRSC